jgi:hypothetical protein
LALLGIGALMLTAAAAGRGRTRMAGAALALAVGGASSAFGAPDLPGLALGAIGAALAVLCFGRPIGVAGGWAGVLLTGFIAAAVLQALAPPTAFLAAWPLTVAALAAAITSLAARRTMPSLAVLLIAGVLGLHWLLAFGHGLYQGLDQPELLAAIAWLSALTLWPLAQPAEDQKGARMAALAVILLGAIAVGVVRFDAPWSARHPQATHVAYYLDPIAGRALRISDAPNLPTWTRKVLAADGGKVERVKLPAYRRSEIWAAAAAPVKATPAKAELVRGEDGAYRLRLTPPPGARTILLSLKTDARLSDAAVNGHPVKLTKSTARILWEAPAEGVTLSFRAEGPGALELAHSSLIDQWPTDAKPLPARPADLMAFGTSGATIVGGARRFTW